MQFEEFSHQYWMSQAVTLAKEIKSEVPVAALIVRDNQLISSAVNKIEYLNDSTAHAEMLAIREASRILGNWRLTGCILYSTLEPCTMCMGAITNSRISTLVFGAYDSSKENQVEVIGGILELEAGKLLKDFFNCKRLKV